MAPSAHRSEIAHGAAAALEAGAPRLRALGALVGFDAFIDSIISVVDRRFAMNQTGFTRIETIEQFALRVHAASGKSTNIELVVNEQRFGGNGPLMAGAMGRLSMPVTYIGAVGQNDRPRELHPLYQELARRCARVIPVAAPAATDALEFNDGKVMLGKPANIQGVTWSSLMDIIGLDEIRRIVSASKIIGVVNWVMMGGVESIWQGLCRDVLAVDPERRSRRVFIDLCDPAKRTDLDVAGAMKHLQAINELTPVTLGLNLAESERIAAVLGLAQPEGPGMGTLGESVRRSASEIRKALGIDCVVVHPREGAGAATADGASAWFDGPFTRTPKLSTGAGDHFNGGFAMAQALGLPLEHCLAAGAGVSGAYVRDAESPTLERLVAFLRELPPPQ